MWRTATGTRARAGPRTRTAGTAIGRRRPPAVRRLGTAERLVARHLLGGQDLLDVGIELLAQVIELGPRARAEGVEPFLTFAECFFDLLLLIGVQAQLARHALGDAGR